MNKIIKLNGQPIDFNPKLATCENKNIVCRGAFTKQKTFRLPCILPDGRIKTIVTTEFVLAGVISEFIQANKESSSDGEILRYVEKDKRKDFIKEYRAADVASQPEKIREIICPKIFKAGYQWVKIIFAEWEVEACALLAEPTTKEFHKMPVYARIVSKKLIRQKPEIDATEQTKIEPPAATVKAKPIVTFSNDFLAVNCTAWKKSESRERVRQATTVLRKLYENYTRGNKPMSVAKIMKGISTERIDKLLGKSRYPQTFSLICQKTDEKPGEQKKQKIWLSDNYEYHAE